MVDRAHATINYQTRINCAHEMDTFCNAVQPGHSRLLTCLGLHINQTGFSVECKRSLTHTDVAALLKKRLKDKISMSIDDFEVFMRMNQGFMSRYGGTILAISVAITFLLSFLISYACLKRKRKKTMYTVSYPNGPDH